eukprot:CAMPEP_0194038570 /NCGR_PEP_ID=MMETSP0009_2-20130614/10792_1 /TAXON_ID=210454 /ORGANISM="Grammatophora oceanica, Strain CCMP 410" /LENGTH=447 /DNA_ID=CAMNT_0038681115 /DNA_START=554 /DNA_END=1897 /DNA_ORIENTATION=+
MERRLLSETNVVTNNSGRDWSNWELKVELDEFVIQISPPLLKPTSTSTIHGWIEKTMYERLFDRTGGDLETLFLANIDAYDERRRRQLEEDVLPKGTKAIRIAKGVAMLNDGSYDSAILNEMARDVVDSGLVGGEDGENYLPKEIEYIASTTYMNPRAAAVDEEDDKTSFGGIQAPINTDEGRSINNKVIGGSVGGLAAVILGLGVALWARRRGGSERDDKEAMNDSIDTVEVDEDDLGSDLDDDELDDEVTSMETGRYVVQNLPPSVHDSEGTNSDQASIGSWTLSTFCTHTRSIQTTESFERDRQTTLLKKDMIGTTEWSAAYGDRSPPRAGALKDTVLQASHFSPSNVAKDEENYQKQQKAPKRTASTSSDSNNSTTPPFLFTSNGEEIYLMPPSQTRSSRIVSYEPAEHPPPSPRLAKKVQAQRAKNKGSGVLRENQRWTSPE